MAVIILHSRVMERISGTFCFEWRYVSGYRNGMGELVLRSKPTTKSRALAAIKRHGLVLSHSTNDGQLFDTPAGDFKALFPDGIRSREEMSLIDKIGRS